MGVHFIWVSWLECSTFLMRNYVRDGWLQTSSAVTYMYIYIFYLFLMYINEDETTNAINKNKRWPNKSMLGFLMVLISEIRTKPSLRGKYMYYSFHSILLIIIFILERFKKKLFTLKSKKRKIYCFSFHIVGHFFHFGMSQKNYPIWVKT